MPITNQLESWFGMMPLKFRWLLNTRNKNEGIQWNSPLESGCANRLYSTIILKTKLPSSNDRPNEMIVSKPILRMRKRRVVMTEVKQSARLRDTFSSVESLWQIHLSNLRGFLASRSLSLNLCWFQRCVAMSQDVATCQHQDWSNQLVKCLRLSATSEPTSKTRKIINSIASLVHMASKLLKIGWRLPISKVRYHRENVVKQAFVEVVDLVGFFPRVVVSKSLTHSHWC